MLTLALSPPCIAAEGQLLKLPANKFTVREREMLIGSGILPREFFEATQNPFVVGIGAREYRCVEQQGRSDLWSVVCAVLHTNVCGDVGRDSAYTLPR
jgi:hypothetical protein